MEIEWRDFPHAPTTTVDLCAGGDVAQDEARSFDVDGFPVLLVRGRAGLVAFINACPHLFLPLDHRSPDVLSDDGKRLRCTNHQAGFDAATGEGIDGLGEGCALMRVPVTEANGRIFLG